MKTIPVSLVLAGSMLGAWALPGPPDDPQTPVAAEKRPGPPDGERRPWHQGVEFWKKADTDGDGFISKDEFVALERISKLPEEKRDKIFERLDKDSDGKLSKEELEKFGPNEGPPRGFPRLAELDVDHSGGVSLEEFKASEFVKKLPVERQEALFKRLDSDGDGQITPKDRPAEPPRRDGEGGPRDGEGGPRGEGRGGRDGGPDGGLRQILRGLDANGDGAVTFEEFQKAPFAEKLGEDALEKRFEKLDRNGDKKLTAEDVPPKPEKPEGEGGDKPEMQDRPHRPGPPPGAAPAPKE
ncbi:EF-hand domain-containing protein [Luteolibacter sp. LG18]|uniref:EF-hand domain-containing protein n=1 Tax=Luteolibacter sp. LG18 TaxID=2819286 RepID=UPI002B325464|nr:hypothetical protein llg_23980 [Luteolibacter sp. LG18]